MKHGESLVKEDSECSICGKEFEYYPCEKEGLLCENCYSDGKNYQHTDEYTEKEISTLLSKEDTEIKKDCNWCGDSFTTERKRDFCSDECVSKFNSDRMEGEDNPRYVDGESRGKKYGKKWKKVRQKSISRDNNSCVICGKKEDIHVHHIIPTQKFDDKKDSHYLENTICLCPKCHRNLEYGNIDIPQSISEELSLEEHKIENFKYLRD